MRKDVVPNVCADYLQLPRLDHSPFELILTRLCASQSWLLPCCHSRGRGTYETCIQDSLSYFGLWSLDGIEAVLVAGVYQCVCVFASACRRSIRVLLVVSKLD